MTQRNSCFCHHCHWLDHCRNSKQLYFPCDLFCNRRKRNRRKELHETKLYTKLLKCTHKFEHVTASLERTRNFVSHNLLPLRCINACQQYTAVTNPAIDSYHVQVKVPSVVSCCWNQDKLWPLMACIWLYLIYLPIYIPTYSVFGLLWPVKSQKPLMFFTFANKKIHVHFVNEQSIYSINMILLRVYVRISYISYIIIYIRITTRAHRFYLNGLVFSLHEIPRNKLLFVFFPCYSLVLTRIHFKNDLAWGS